jgi:hypothetical protein
LILVVFTIKENLFSCFPYGLLVQPFFLQGLFSDDEEEVEEEEDDDDDNNDEDKSFLFYGSVGGGGGQFKKCINGGMLDAYLISLFATLNSISSTSYSIVDGLSRAASLSASSLDACNTFSSISLVCCFHFSDIHSLIFSSFPSLFPLHMS